MRTQGPKLIRVQNLSAYKWNLFFLVINPLYTSHVSQRNFCCKSGQGVCGQLHHWPQVHLPHHPLIVPVTSGWGTTGWASRSTPLPVSLGQSFHLPTLGSVVSNKQHHPKKEPWLPLCPVDLEQVKLLVGTSSWFGSLSTCFLHNFPWGSGWCLSGNRLTSTSKNWLGIWCRWGPFGFISIRANGHSSTPFLKLLLAVATPMIPSLAPTLYLLSHGVNIVCRSVS